MFNLGGSHGRERVIPLSLFPKSPHFSASFCVLPPLSSFCMSYQKSLQGNLTVFKYMCRCESSYFPPKISLMHLEDHSLAYYQGTFPYYRWKSIFRSLLGFQFSPVWNHGVQAVKLQWTRLFHWISYVSSFNCGVMLISVDVVPRHGF